MTSAKDHCEERGNGELLSKGSWIIVSTVVMEPCDDKRHGAL